MAVVSLLVSGTVLAAPQSTETLHLDANPLSGVVEADHLLIDEPQTLTGDVVLIGRQSLTIASDLVAAPANGAGHSIRLVSNGPITISGTLQAGDAGSWSTRVGEGSLIGNDGLAGGSITIEGGAQGVVYLEDARLIAGRGSDGQSVWAAGSAEVPDAVAEAGMGGAGGTITIAAGIDHLSTGSLLAGFAGDGGDAEATGWNASVGDGGAAEATAGDGGLRGTVVLLNAPVGVEVHEGDGGEGGGAVAIGGNGAAIRACGQDGGNGGSTVRIGPSTQYPPSAVAYGGAGTSGQTGCNGSTAGAPGESGGRGGAGGPAFAKGGRSTKWCGGRGGDALAVGGSGARGGVGGNGATGATGPSGVFVGGPGGPGGAGGKGGDGGPGGKATAQGGMGTPYRFWCGGYGGHARAYGGHGGDAGNGGIGGDGGAGGKGLICQGLGGQGGAGGPGGAGGAPASASATGGYGGRSIGNRLAVHGTAGDPGVAGDNGVRGPGRSPADCPFVIEGVAGLDRVTGGITDDPWALVQQLEDAGLSGADAAWAAAELAAKAPGAAGRIATGAVNAGLGVAGGAGDLAINAASAAVSAAQATTEDTLPGGQVWAVLCPVADPVEATC